MRAQIRIRPAAEPDADSVGHVYLSSRKQFLAYAPLIHSDDDVCQWIAKILIPKGGVSVALLGDRIVGMMVLSKHGSIGWIDQLYLLPEVVGLGIGSALVTYAKEILGQPIRLYSFQENEGARRFYERNGFTAIEFGDGSANEEHCPDILYEWDQS